MAGKKMSLLAQLKALPPSRARNWYDGASPETRAELEILKKSFAAGEITQSASAVHRFYAEALGLQVKRGAFSSWLRGD